MSSTSKNNFKYRRVEKSDSLSILNFLLEYFPNAEPCFKALNLDAKSLKPLLESIIDRCVQTPFSTIVHSSSGEIAAVLLNSIWSRFDSPEGGDFLKNANFSPILLKFVDFLNSIHEDFWSIAPSNVNIVLHREVSLVNPKFQRQGIATKMVTEHLTLANIQKYQIDGIISETTSFANQTLLKKQGFKALKIVSHKSFVNENGEQFIKTDDGSEAIVLNFKQISDFLNLSEA